MLRNILYGLQNSNIFRGKAPGPPILLGGMEYPPNPLVGLLSVRISPCRTQLLATSLTNCMTRNTLSRSRRRTHVRAASTAAPSYLSLTTIQQCSVLIAKFIAVIAVDTLQWLDFITCFYPSRASVC